MTPTLFGRWQTRILLFAVVGSLISLPFFVFSGANPVFFVVLIYIAAFGMVWDSLYNYLQQYRWDHDWPAALQLIAGIWEGLFFGILFNLIPLPGVPQDEISVGVYIVHYSLVWVVMFTVSQTVMRIFFPRWRFFGGQWL
ncbi:MAG: hypothetical protein HC769_08465 [Cyanobacteria bacterium CRU_2_1]|nr:hypothetical protein [Cyanobacteria bacterium RU_5_0]NJR58877.1 hypothetical protein [Cyanobacteria bacterium CRU_2_1]